MTLKAAVPDRGSGLNSEFVPPVLGSHARCFSRRVRLPGRPFQVGGFLARAWTPGSLDLVPTLPPMTSNKVFTPWDLSFPICGRGSCWDGRSATEVVQKALCKAVGGCADWHERRGKQINDVNQNFKCAPPLRNPTRGHKMCTGWFPGAGEDWLVVQPGVWGGGDPPRVGMGKKARASGTRH